MPLPGLSRPCALPHPLLCLSITMAVCLHHHPNVTPLLLQPGKEPTPLTCIIQSVDIDSNGMEGAQGMGSRGRHLAAAAANGPRP